MYGTRRHETEYKREKENEKWGDLGFLGKKVPILKSFFCKTKPICEKVK